jgi:hypothetical protein
VYIVPPSDFDVSSDHPSMTKGDYGIIVKDTPGGNFWSNTRNFTKENFESRGITVHEIRNLQINGLPAILVDIEGDFRTTQLVFGDSTFSALITGTAPKDNPDLNNEIKTSILSVYYDSGYDFNPIEQASFTFELDSSDLKFSNFSGDMFIFTTDGVDDQLNHSDGAVLIVSEYPLESEDISNKTIIYQFVDNLKKQAEIFEIVDEGKGEIDGRESYFVEAESELGGKPVLLRNVSVKTKTKIFIVQAVAYENLSENMQEFKNILKTMKLK